MIDFSVIVSTDRDGHYVYRLLRNIKKIVGSSPFNIEVLCIVKKDDYETIKYLKKGQSLFKGIKILTQDYSNVIAAKETAVKNSKGKYILFIEGKDLISLNLLERAYKRFETLGQNEKVILISDVRIFFESNSLIIKNYSTESSSFRKSILLFENPWGNNFLIKKSDCKSFGPSTKSYSSHQEPSLQSFFCDWLAKEGKVLTLSETVTFVRGSERKEVKEGYVLEGKKIFDCRTGEETLNYYTQEIKEDNRFFLKKAISSLFPSFYRKLHVLKKNFNDKISRLFDKDDKRNFAKKFFSIFLPKTYLRIFIFKEFLKKKYRSNTKEIYPGWLVKIWKDMNIIDPSLFPPSYKIMESSPSYNENIDRYLCDFLSVFPKEIDYLIVCPWLKIGGADKLTLNLVKGLRKIFPSKSIGLILTENTESNRLEDLPEDIFFFDFGHSFYDLNYTEREILLLRFFIQTQAKKVININSHSLFNLLIKYSKILSCYSKIYCFCFSPSKTREGQRTGFSFDFIPKIINDLELVLTDNKNIISVLVDMFGLDQNKFRVLYQPVEVGEIFDKINRSADALKILWASRIDYEKLPDILEKIIVGLRDEDFQFHIYGDSVMDEKFPLKRFSRNKNAFVYGAYKGGLHGIDVSNYDLFLYTSAFDGMPNTVLEALSLGLPVIASNVGGIKEVIEDGKTGFLVNDIYDENSYIEKIRKVAREADLLNNIRKNAVQRIKLQHSLEGYRKELYEIFK